MQVLQLALVIKQSLDNWQAFTAWMAKLLFLPSLRAKPGDGLPYGGGVSLLQACLVSCSWMGRLPLSVTGLQTSTCKPGSVTSSWFTISIEKELARWFYLSFGRFGENETTEFSERRNCQPHVLSPCLETKSRCGSLLGQNILTL